MHSDDQRQPPGRAALRVLVTRPAPEARHWADQLAALGFDAQSLPLIDIQPVTDHTALRHAWGGIGQMRAVMCVSAAAVLHFMAARPDATALDMALLPRFWAPGPGTARALQAAGIAADRIDSPAIDSAQFDSEALWAVVGGGMRAGDRVLIVRGEDALLADAQTDHAPVGHGRQWMAQTLEAHGVVSQYVVAYRRQRPDWMRQTASAAPAGWNGAAWVFSNSEAIGTLLRWLPAAGCLPASAVCTHPRIAAAARAAGFHPVIEARPAIESVAAALDALTHARASGISAWPDAPDAAPPAV